MKHNKQYTKDDILALLSRIETEVIGRNIDPESATEKWAKRVLFTENHLKEKQRQSLNKIIEEYQTNKTGDVE